MATTPQNLASIANIMAINAAVPPTMTSLNRPLIFNLSTASNAPAAANAISTYIISAVIARSTE